MPSTHCDALSFTSLKGNAAQHVDFTRDGRRSSRGGGSGGRGGERGGLSRALRQGTSGEGSSPPSDEQNLHVSSGGDTPPEAAPGEGRQDSSGQQGPGLHRHTSANHLLNFQRYDMRATVCTCAQCLNTRPRMCMLGLDHEVKSIV